MKLLRYYIVCAGLALLTSCLEDRGNYDYVPLNKATIYFDTYGYLIFAGDTLRLSPKVKFENPADSVHFTREWLMDGKLCSIEDTLVYIGKDITSFQCQLNLVDKRTDVRQFSSIFYVTVGSPYKEGWAILYEKDGISEVGQVTLMNNSQGQKVHKIFRDVYKTLNHEDLGSQPYKLIEHFAGKSYKDSELLIMQKGGQGCVELDGMTMKKQLTTKQEFLQEIVPVNFQPKDIAYVNYTHLILNQDGKVYSRYIPDLSLGFHASAYSDVPGFSDRTTIGRLINSSYHKTYHILLYDSYYRRFLGMGSANPSFSGSIAELYYRKYPDGYTPLNNLGDMQLIYSASHSDNYNNASYENILRSPGGTYYLQTFDVRFSSYSGCKLTVPATNGQYEFNGGQYLTEQSLFWRLKTRNYLFFTGGVRNEILYYYDTKTKLAKEYETMKDVSGNTVRIMAIHPCYGNMQMGIVLENGEFRIYDISNDTFSSNIPVLIYRAEGFGKPVDLIYRYGSGRNMWL